MEISKVNRNNLESALSNLDLSTVKTEMQPLLRGANLTVTQPKDLEKLAAQLAAETNDKASVVAKKSVASSFAAVLARVLEMKSVDESNMQVLDEAKQIGDEIDSLDAQMKEQQREIDSLTDKLHQEEREVNGLKKQESQLEKTKSDLSKHMAELDKQIATTTDPIKKQQLEAKRAELAGQLEQTETSIASVKAQLQVATANLSATQKSLGDAAQKMAETMSQKDLKKEALKKKLEELKDKELLEAIIDMLKQEKADVSDLIEEKKVKRSDEEEKYLDEHSPVKIIQDMLDDISERMEEKI